MKKIQSILYAILGLTSVLAGSTIHVFFQLPKKIEWFQLYGIAFYLIIFAIVYIIILLGAGVFARIQKKEYSNILFKATKWSALILLVAIVIGFVSGKNKVDNYMRQMNSQQDSIELVN